MDQAGSAPSSDTALDRERSRLLAWQNGHDAAGIDEILRACRPRIAAMARRISSEHAEDLAAEGMLALMRAARRWQPVGDLPFISYGGIAARHAMVSALQRLRSGLSVPERHLRDVMSGRDGSEDADALRVLMVGEVFDEAMAPASPAAEDEALRRERHALSRRLLAEALRGLGAEERRLVVEHRLHERSDIASLARRLGISPLRARQLEERALQKMRNALLRGGHGVEDLNG